MNCTYIRMHGATIKEQSAVLSTTTGELSRSQWMRGLRSGFEAARLLGLQVRTPPPDACVSVSFEYWVSGRGLCFGLITRSEESNRVHVSECDRKASIMIRSLPTRGCCAMKKKSEGINTVNTFSYLFEYLPDGNRV